MNVDPVNSTEASLRTLQLFNVEKFMDGYKETGDVLFARFDVYDNTNLVSAVLMKDIAAYARKSLDISKPVNLHGLRYSRVAQKSEWMHRNMDTINLPGFKAVWKIYCPGVSLATFSSSKLWIYTLSTAKQ